MIERVKKKRRETNILFSVVVAAAATIGECETAADENTTEIHTYLSEEKEK